MVEPSQEQNTFGLAETTASDASVQPSPTEGILACTKTPKQRVWEIDFLRGFCVLLMILDHTALLLFDFFGRSWYGYKLAGDSFGAELCRLCQTYWYSGLREVGHPIVLFIFFAISGISCAFSRSNLKRGIQLAIVSLLYTLGSYIADDVMGISGTFVAFGVLHFYAVCILLWAAICGAAKLLTEKNLLKRATDVNGNDLTLAKESSKSGAKAIRTLISAAIVVTVLGIFHCYKAPADTPEWLFFLFPYKNADGSGSAFYYINDVSPGDLFNLIPWSAFFFFGTFIQPFIYPKKRSLLPKLDRGWQRPVSFLGRHALLVYILHIFLVAFILMLISMMAFGTWGLF